MKKILIVIAVLFLGIYGYSRYRELQRFNPPSHYVYEINNEIDINYYDPEVVDSYYKNTQDLELFARSAWSNQRVDVLYPRNNKPLDKSLAQEFASRKAKIEKMESRLLQSARMKDLGLNNADIKAIELSGLSVESYRAQSVLQNLDRPLQLNDNGQMVYLLQRYLKALDYDLTLDGIYKEETSEAVAAFQEKNQLLPTGRADKITFQKLLAAQNN